MTVAFYFSRIGWGKRKPLGERLWKKVRKAGINDCWVWTGHVDTNGYGQLGYKDHENRQRMLLVHRLSYEIHVDPIPKGRDLRHTCDNPVCVNPRHLILGTHQENMTDRAVRERGGNNILTAVAVKDIRARYANGERVIDLAAEYKVNQLTAYDAISRRTWKHVP